MKDNTENTSTLAGVNKNLLNRVFGRTLQNSADCIIITNHEGMIEYVNPRFQAMFGYTSEEATGMNFLAIQADKGYSPFFKELWPKVLSGQIWKEEVPHFNQSGEKLWHMIRIAPVKDEKNTTVHVIINLHDITTQKRTEEKFLQNLDELKKANRLLDEKTRELTRLVADLDQANKRISQSEAHYRLLAENINDIIWILDIKTLKWTYVTPSIYKISGLTVEEAKNRPLSHTLTPESTQRALKSINEWIQRCQDGDQNPAPPQEEFQFICKDGSIIWIEATFTLLTDKDGNPAEVLGVSRDINRRKLAELSSNKSLEKFEELNRIKDRFFSIIAHDLRNPFNGILGSVQLLKNFFDKYTPAEQMQLIDIIDESAISGNLLLENLLKWSLAQTGKLEVNPEPFDLNEIADACIGEVISHAICKNQKIIKNVFSTIPVVADRNLLSFVLRNLLSNAIKFTPDEGKISLTAHIEPEQVLVSVEDTGIGIEPADFEEIFMIGNKALRKGTHNEPSSGLGLVLSRDFVEKQGGKIWVESYPGNGSKFYFTLPSQRKTTLL